MSDKITAVKVILNFKGVEIALSLEEIEELKVILKKFVPDGVVKEKEFVPYPVWPYWPYCHWTVTPTTGGEYTVYDNSTPTIYLNAAES